MLERLHTADAVFEGKKVLIVDDDVRNVFALTSVFERRGMEVLFAENGRDGHRGAQGATRTSSLVLMDIMMPEMDGYEATRAVREMPGVRAAPDRGAHRQGDEGRPREEHRLRARPTTSRSRSTWTSCCR